MEESMKKLLSISLLMLCLSFPALAGHNVAGGGYCEPCGIGECVCDGTGQQSASAKTQESNGSEILLSLFVLLMLLRYKA